MEATLRRRARHESEGDAPCCDGEEAAADEDCEDSDDDDEEDEAEDEMRLFSTAKTVRDVPRERTGDMAWPAVTSPSRSPWRPPPPPPCMLHKRSAGRTRPHSRGVVFSGASNATSALCEIFLHLWNLEISSQEFRDGIFVF
jgi:hypothetical protein